MKTSDVAQRPTATSTAAQVILVFDESGSMSSHEYQVNRQAETIRQQKTRTPRLPTSAHTDVPVIFGGPFICIATDASDLTDATDIAWFLASAYSRTSQNHPYLCGMQAVSGFSGNDLKPPIYALGVGDAAIAADAVTLAKKWRGEAVVTVSQYETLLAAAVARPGLARLVNAALVPYIVLADPVP